ncbi:helix-turn-helix domain-containing protein [Streptomyces cyaneofuscatus]
MSKSSSIDSARRTLGRQLRSLRESAGMTGRALAQAAGWHESKCSRIENGRVQPSDTDITTWATLCGAEDQTEDLLNIAHGIHVMHREWREMERDGLARVHTAAYPDWEGTRMYKGYAQCMIPAPLQTEDYTHTVLSALQTRRQIRGGPRPAPDDIEAALQNRIHRKKLLLDPDREFHVVMEEAALRHLVVDQQTMIEQLAHLLQATGLESVRLGIIPQTADRTATWPVEDFWIFDERQVRIELVSAFLQITQPSETRLYRETFDELASQAAYGRQATLLIVSALADLASTG